MSSIDEGLPSDIDVSLEFRTHKTDGLLMIFDGTDGSQTMVLELHQGQVSASCFLTLIYGRCYKISNISCLPKSPRLTGQTQIRLLPKKQSDQGLTCLLF